MFPILWEKIHVTIWQKKCQILWTSYKYLSDIIQILGDFLDVI
ncbi:hypothetical protein ANACAC_02876 [Anaerostipes caccae L1-92]|uniref:Uncharacterized protein n=1 Tax=Anaerostipes caccae (strain DSM 14662 / CCUG 47493 / JCM 13470 / NCIMB 13811 / L1-92) TaxID=411490 RepID=B0MHB4_ANACD|nr:hypothetical protein ANACAC_02876 [Anaerostipes caccae L1-92]